MKWDQQQSKLNYEERQLRPKEPQWFRDQLSRFEKQQSNITCKDQAIAAESVLSQVLPEESDQNQMESCPHCARTFMQGRLERHLKSCNATNPMKKLNMRQPKQGGIG
jgi:acetyl-CoA carboxylase beta subunit